MSAMSEHDSIVRPRRRRIQGWRPWRSQGQTSAARVLDQTTLQARGRRSMYLASLTMEPPGPGVSYRGDKKTPHIADIRDAANECRHGTLPTDKAITCQCWPTT